jgi:hypothetical protein
LRRIGVEVEQAPARRHGGIEIARIVEPELRLDVVIAGAEPDHAGAMGQAEAATVNPVSRVFHAGHSASGQEIEKTRDVARRPVREPELDAAGDQLGVTTVADSDGAVIAPMFASGSRGRPRRVG